MSYSYAHHTTKTPFVNNLHSQFLRFLKLTSGFRPCKQVVCLLAHRRTHFPSSLLNKRFCLLTGESGERAGEDEGFPRENLFHGGTFGKKTHDAAILKLMNERSVV